MRESLRLQIREIPILKFPYHRFDVLRDLGHIQMEVWEKYVGMTTLIKECLNQGETATQLSACVKHLTNLESHEGV